MSLHSAQSVCITVITCCLIAGPDALDIGRFEKSLNEIEQHPYLHCGHCQSEKTVGTKHIVVLEGTMILKLE